MSTNEKIDLNAPSSYLGGIDPEWIASGDSIKGLLLGMASAPLLLVSVYFFKASPRFFSKEHGISLLAYMACSFLVSLGVLFYGLPAVITSFQILPILNQIFVSSFSLSIESISSIMLTTLSVYFSLIGYSGIEKTSSFSWIALVLFLVVLSLSIMRLTSHSDYIRRRFEIEKYSDLLCMLVLSFEGAIGFVSLCSFAYLFNILLPIVALLTSMSFLLAMEKALYYYPATAVIPIFTILVRVIGAIFSLQIYSNAYNGAVGLSLILGVVSSIFPLILA
ncbi:hypothetical protein NEAUS04_0019 [Nematocida ausubeli]|uniref:Uncharacterized protein n=1 Tax=Nematocida ausubeli (strain ATCC PRA-371 / ERTm2) TaxID=1913371 RepID=H8ZCF3_NEMA1|nr:uncharacterized protein NESG_02217 [Nematocida ausubeli]EHY65789.1 hypothetical protein NERG_01396 [Nematocida ausubeli]KAI5132060.1 hypothetical protein NEAUS07_0059 [Nematocida ausubeli]KAI5132835.1 hypothetical protein NEAUS06_0381 [Nematocida ausubeli]KAI5135258.1 hypothetical protein NEAUS07_1094 [Nematocida ausubeli]KAI5147130.1 hypothetical protein NEAUS05_0455 [Nematocida ausubeli]